MRHARIRSWLAVVLAALALSAVVACTAPTQKHAEAALAIQNQQYATIHEDLTAIAKQALVDKGVAIARLAAVEGNADMAQENVEKFVNKLEQIDWLNAEFLKTRWGPTALVQNYVWTQQGILDILWREGRQAGLFEKWLGEWGQTPSSAPSP